MHKEEANIKLIVIKSVLEHFIVKFENTKYNLKYKNDLIWATRSQEKSYFPIIYY